MGSIPNGSAPLQACARQILMFMPPGRTGKAQVYFGQASASDFTIHKDEARKQRYIDRHKKNEFKY